MQCNDCKHYEESKANDGFGYCWRYPPTQISSPPEMVEWSNPIVDGGHWCGEHDPGKEDWVFHVETGNCDSIASQIQERLDDGWELCGSMLNVTQADSNQYFFAQPMRCRV